MPTAEPATTFRSTVLRDLEQVADHHTIVDGLYAFQTMLDGKKWNEIRTAMQEGVHAYGARGIDDAVAVMRAHLDVCGATQHLMGNVQVRLEGDFATTRSSFRAFHTGAGAYTGSVYECLGYYDDSWIRAGERWKLVRRVISVRAESGDRAVIGISAEAP